MGKHGYARDLAERALAHTVANKVEAAYQRTVLGALRDVETALVSYAQSQVRHERLAAEVTADREAVAIATRLYKQGLNDFLSVLDAERSLYASDDKLAQSERDTALERVALYKALGGGWQAEGDAENRQGT